MTAGEIVALDARLIGGQSTGDSTYWTGLLHGLQALDSQIQYLLFTNGSPPEEIPDCDRFRWISVPSRRNRWWSLFRFPLSARRMGASAIHTQYNLSPLAGTSGITTVHDVSFYVGPEWFRPRDRLLLSRFVPASCRRAARILTVSETSKREIAANVPDVQEKIRVTHPAAGLGIKAMHPNRAREIIREMGVLRPYILTVGTRWPRKNMGLAVAACELLPESLPHRLVLTGKSGWGEQEAGARTQSVGYVTDEQLTALYSCADLYLAPSRHEGFGITALEAMRCGCPVLASTGGALPEAVGKAGELEPSWEPEAWAARMALLLGDSSKLQRLREAGLARERTFTWEETARRTESVYREVLHDRP